MNDATNYLRIIIGIGAATLSANAAAAGIGVAIFESGSVAASNGANVFATFAATDSIDLEPFVHYNTFDETDSNGRTTSATDYSYGVGILSTIDKRDNMKTYVGVRLAETNISYNYSTGTSEYELLSITPLGGLEYGLNKNFSIGCEIGYSWTDGQYTSAFSASSNSDISGNSLFSSIMMRYRFSNTE